MKMFIFSDSLETYNGLRLVGVEGLFVPSIESADKTEIFKSMDELINSGEYGIIMVTPKIREFLGEFLEEKMKMPQPLFVTVPDRESSMSNTNNTQNSLSDYIKKTLGVNI